MLSQSATLRANFEAADRMLLCGSERRNLQGVHRCAVLCNDPQLSGGIAWRVEFRNRAVEHALCFLRLNLVSLYSTITHDLTEFDWSTFGLWPGEVHCFVDSDSVPPICNLHRVPNAFSKNFRLFEFSKANKGHHGFAVRHSYANVDVWKTIALANDWVHNQSDCLKGCHRSMISSIYRLFWRIFRSK